MKRLTTALLLLLALGAGSAMAAPDRPGGFYRAAEKSAGISLDQAAEQVRKETGGRILSATTVNKDGRLVHRIKVLTPEHKVVIREISAGGR